MDDINRIITLIDEYLESNGRDRVEANEISLYLEKKGALSYSTKGQPFRRLLREGKIPNAEQPGGKRTAWYIRHSNKGIIKPAKSRPPLAPKTNKVKEMTPAAITKGLEYIADLESEILILGTLPGKESLKTRQYYANPNNQFWEIISIILNEPMPDSYEGKLKVLKRNHIALWDVLKSANRDSSLDSDIKNPVTNDILEFISKHPKLRVIGFNGEKAATIFRTYIGLCDLPQKVFTVLLPSSSSSNSHSTIAGKADRWKMILKT